MQNKSLNIKPTHKPIIRYYESLKKFSKYGIEHELAIKEAFLYKLGNRSAIEWVIDRYQVKTDARSKITNDPNGYSDDEMYILNLVEKVVRVSLETVKIVSELENTEI